MIRPPRKFHFLFKTCKLNNKSGFWLSTQQLENFHFYGQTLRKTAHFLNPALHRMIAHACVWSSYPLDQWAVSFRSTTIFKILSTFFFFSSNLELEPHTHKQRELFSSIVALLCNKTQGSRKKPQKTSKILVFHHYFVDTLLPVVVKVVSVANDKIWLARNSKIKIIHKIVPVLWSSSGRAKIIFVKIIKKQIT